MRARQKLNRGYLQGSLLLAGLLGWMTSSWLIFLVAGTILVAGNVAAREIRLDRQRHDPDRP